MKLFKKLHIHLKLLTLFVGITGIFSLPGLVRCSGEVDSQADSSRFASATVNR